MVGLPLAGEWELGRPITATFLPGVRHIGCVSCCFCHIRCHVASCDWSILNIDMENELGHRPAVKRELLNMSIRYVGVI